MASELAYYQPDETEQTVLSFLMIPSAILSLLGSSYIIRSIRAEKKSSPYRRLMLAMSVCDIISTVAYVLQPFFGPRDSPFAYVMTIGNDATCTMIGAWNQMTYMAHWYAAALSFYFVSTVRYGVSETTFAKNYERWIHSIIITFHVVTAVFGVVGDVYFQRQINPGCWVATPPHTCSGANCYPVLIAYIFGFPTIVALFVVLINNIRLYTHVKHTILEGQRKAMEAEERLRMYQQKQQQQLQKADEDKKESALEPTNNNATPNSVLQSSNKQWERVRQVRIQSALYVLAYLITFLWSAIINILVGRDFEDHYQHAGRVYFPLLVLQAIFVPSQGVFNAMVFFRPKFLASRNKFPKQTRSWCARRSVYGEKIKARALIEVEDMDGVAAEVTEEEEKAAMEVAPVASTRDPSSIIPQGSVSSVPASAAEESERYFSSGRNSGGTRASGRPAR
ncbi:MAG: hypothetical protein SGBAC_011967 [Bacillariaceae sp.]